MTPRDLRKRAQMAERVGSYVCISPEEARSLARELEWLRDHAKQKIGYTCNNCGRRTVAVDEHGRCFEMVCRPERTV